MNPISGVILATWCLFTILAISAKICSASTQNDFEPIYFIHGNFGSQLVFHLKRDVTGQLYSGYYSDCDVYAACPKDGDGDSLEVVARESSIMALTQSCQRPVQAKIYKTKDAEKFLNMIAFPVHMRDNSAVHEYIDAPPNHVILELIEFQFDNILHRTKFVHYIIATGRILKPDSTTENEKDKEYKKNEDFYGFDIDSLYSQTAHSLVKVQLSPEEDFFFENWKSASRQNILTAPMWKDLLPQWRALEKFIRKVSRVIYVIGVETGIHGILTQIDTNNGSNVSQEVYLHNGKYPLPTYFWKAVRLIFPYGAKVYRMGILFVMHNFDPNATYTESQKQKICPNDDVSGTGWQFEVNSDVETLIYGCFYNEKNMSIFGDKPEGKFQLFDLNNVTTLEPDDHGDMKMIKINVLQEIRRLEETEKNYGIQNHDENSI